MWYVCIYINYWKKINYNVDSNIDMLINTRLSKTSLFLTGACADDAACANNAVGNVCLAAVDGVRSCGTYVYI